MKNPPDERMRFGGMRQHARKLRPSPAMAVALLALFVSLSGNAVALQGRLSIDHNDLRPHVVHRGKIHDGAVNSAKLSRGAVRASDLARVLMVSQSVTVPPNNQDQTAAFCPEGSKRISGGAESGVFGVPISGTRPELTARGWGGYLRNNSSTPVTLKVWVLCLAS